MTLKTDTGVILDEVILYDADGNPTVLKIDPVTGAVVTIDYPHKKIHGGDGYDYTEVEDQSGNEVYDIQITCPIGAKHAHLTIEFDVEAETEFWFWENVNIVNPGTEITPRNHNRNYDDNSILTMKGVSNSSLSNANDDTDISGATSLMHKIVGAGKKVGGSASSREEWPMKAGEDYTLRWEALSAGWVSWHIDWYEQTNPAFE